MIKSYKYRLNPTKSQAEFFEKSFGCARYVYNWALEKRISAYKNDKINLSFYDICLDLTRLKRQDNMTWLNEVCGRTLQISIHNMSRAFDNFFKHNTKFPRFKSKHGNKQSYTCSGSIHIDFNSNKIKLPRVGWIKFFKNREFSGIIKTATITKTSSSKYFASILIDDRRELPEKFPITENASIGIDVGIKYFAVLSNGEVIQNPKYLEDSEKRLKVLQKRFSRKQKDSKRREKARIALAKQYEKVTNRRNDFLHKLSSRIVRENQTIIIEDLNVEGMARNHSLSKHIYSVSWGEFFRQLQYKCDWYGRNLVKIGRFKPSSKMCKCGYINKDLKLSEREWICPSCGRHNDRDLLAAQNIKQFGLEKITPRGAGNEHVEGRGYEPAEA